MESRPTNYELYINGEQVVGYAEDCEIEEECCFDLERMKKVINSSTAYPPKELKEKEEILEWLLHYGTGDNKDEK